MSYDKFFNDLKIPLKETSKTFKIIFTYIAEAFEEFKRYAERIMDEHYAKVSKDVDLFAKDRGIIRLKKESSTSYRNRVVGAYSFYKHSSTLQGIKDIISSAITQNFIIRELYQEDWILGEEPLGVSAISLDDGTAIIKTILGDENTLFYFIVEIKDRIYDYEKIYLEELINTYKPAYMGYHLDVMVHLDEWKLDGSKLLGITTHAVVIGE